MGKINRLLRVLPGLALAAALATTGTALAQQPAKPAAKPSAQMAKFDATACFGCHAPVKEFHDSGKHKGLACSSCHSGIDNHLGNPSQRPTTSTDPATCGGCHKNQFDTSFQMDWHRTARSEKKQMTGPSPNPSFDYLMTPHGFTREHNLPRSHAFMVLDQFVVDRAFGGRFSPKDSWRYLGKPASNFKVWDVIQDNYPDNTDQKPFKPGTAAAANPVCVSCKTMDHILDWAYMGDPVPGAKWSRTSKVVEFVKSVNHANNCIFCHDPHAAKPRVVRDALIQALTRKDFPTLYSEDPKKTKFEVKDMGVRGYTRKIAMLESYDSKLQCAQCHVEYNCNPGVDPKTGAAIGMADQRTNIFPLTSVANVSKFYDSINFRDFRHFQTGALLTKVQHPDAEVFWNSKHDKAGVQCSSCHMPKVTDPKTKKTYTSHWQTNPRQYVKQTCLTCHTDWSEEQAKYTMDSMASHYAGKVRHAEFWLTQLINKFGEVQASGIVLEDATLAAARAKHDEAHVNWEWWTASNGSAFHNLDQAKESLAKSATASQEGIKILGDALAAKRKAMTGTAATSPVVAAPASAPAAAK
jgi:formate-dependent nitrite reductase cytochrome c552 subunit